MEFYRYLPHAGERHTDPLELVPSPPCDGLFEALDTLRHEAFALQNRLFCAPPEACARLERLLGHNKAAQAKLRRELSQFNCIF
ncbi:hypothetical protein DSECCO2_625620 [anaerobic digester metagenome]